MPSRVFLGHVQLWLETQELRISNQCPLGHFSAFPRHALRHSPGGKWRRPTHIQGMLLAQPGALRTPGSLRRAHSSLPCTYMARRCLLQSHEAVICLRALCTPPGQPRAGSTHLEPGKTTTIQKTKQKTNLMPGGFAAATPEAVPRPRPPLDRAGCGRGKESLLTVRKPWAPVPRPTRGSECVWQVAASTPCHCPTWNMGGTPF